MGRPDFSGLERDGWMAMPRLLTAQEASVLAQRCEGVLSNGDDQRQGDKRVSGTRRASDVLHRVEEIAALFDTPALSAAVASMLGSGTEWPVSDVAFRCPQPGFGKQSLHADDVAIERAGECWAVTAIVALCDFTRDNGATAVVPGSHRRPDLQREWEARSWPPGGPADRQGGNGICLQCPPPSSGHAQPLGSPASGSTGGMADPPGPVSAVGRDWR